MTTIRPYVLANDQIYHIFNRGVEKRPTFTSQSDYKRALTTLRYYRFSQSSIKLSRILSMSETERQSVLSDLESKHDVLIDILAFCFMPNHFHFLVKQRQDKGISTFMSQFTNSYTRYFNTKNDRVGPLFQGIFKAILVETDQQLVHLSRYIHINPVASYVIEKNRLLNYQWSSLPQYVGSTQSSLCNDELILSFFNGRGGYADFVADDSYLDKAQELEYIKHLTLE